MAAEEAGYSRGLAVFVGAQGWTCCVRPGPNIAYIAVRVKFMARHVPSEAGNETSEDYETHFVRVRLLFINSQSIYR